MIKDAVPRQLLLLCGFDAKLRKPEESTERSGVDYGGSPIAEAEKTQILLSA